MKFTSLTLASVAILIASCSKPSGDNTTASPDSTAVASDQVETPTDNRKRADLTPAELERMHSELWAALHNAYMEDAGPQAFPYYDNLEFSGSDYTYTIHRHNGKDAAAWQPEGDGRGDDWVSAIDTLETRGSLIVIDAIPDNRVIRPVIGEASGNIIRILGQFVNIYGNREDSQETFNVPTLNIDLGVPMRMRRDKLYVKARVADLTEDDLAEMSKDELSWFRNEIFARHGHIFKTEKMQKYFADKEWYFPFIDDATKVMTKYEKRNVEFIKKKEG